MYEKSKTACFIVKDDKFTLKKFNKKNHKLKKRLKNKLKNAIKNGYELFLLGFDLGIDIWAAKLILDLKKKYPQIKVEAAIPFEEQASDWRKKDMDKYFNLLFECDIVTYVNKRYTPNCINERNCYMVKRSNLIIII